MRTRALALAAAVVAAAVGCRRDMQDQPKYRPLRPSGFFDDGRSARPLVDGTVARGGLADGPGRPGAPTRALLLRGRERYDIYCSPCHDRAGTGRGIVVERGFRHPPSLHETRLRAAPDAHLLDVITTGFGVMPSYAVQVAPGDRQAIVAYVRALQLSQGATLADVPPAERARLEAESPR
jgi:hypothetical protein